MKWKPFGSPAPDGSGRGLRIAWRGYDVRQVDAYLDELEAGTADPDALFDVVLRGYDSAQVDSLLDDLRNGGRT